MLSKDKALYADIRAAIHNGSEVVFESENAILVREKNTGFYFMGGTDTEKLKELCGTLQPDKHGKTFVIIRSPELKEYLVNSLGFSGGGKWCFQAEYDREEPVKAEPRMKFEIRKPGPEDKAKLRATYELADDDGIDEIFNDPYFYGAYSEDGELMGYIGRHSEGSLGVLYVFEKYRGHGLAEALQAHIINCCKSDGGIPYGHIFETNTASIKLSRKLGLTFSEGRICWLWKETTE